MEKENENTSKLENKEEILNNENNSEKEQKEELTLEDKLKETEDKLARSYAELENQRRRYEKEKEEAYEYGGMAFAKECLNLTDNLERSKLSIINDESLEKNNKDKIIEHLDIIYKDILSIFKKNQIDEISALGEKLDPNKHQAMLEIEDAEKEQGTIVQEIQKGFTLKGRLLRPSLVGVSKKPQKNEEKQQKKEKN
jgi:molecular chaperone GrpE